MRIGIRLRMRKYEVKDVGRVTMEGGVDMKRQSTFPTW
jgi:hypothetical protein